MQRKTVKDCRPPGEQNNSQEISKGDGTFWAGHRLFLWQSHRRVMSPQLEMLKGTLDLMVLQTLEAMGALHGYGIARRIEQISGDAILLNQGTIYASLVRLQQRGLIRSAWGTSDNNRRAKFYSITHRGSRRLAQTAENWEQPSTVIARFFAAQKEPSR
jgi:PadR family transcriptional regulator PadR